MLFHFDHRLCFFIALFSLFLSWTLCALRNRPLSRRLFLPFSHSTHLRMSLSRISRQTHNHRLSRTEVLLVLAALILPCVLPLVTSQSMAPGTDVPPGLETFLRYMSRRQTEQLAVLTNNIASMQSDMQKQISELMAIATQTTKSMQDQQARSIEIDKTLAELRAHVVALQSAFVSSVETKSASSDWLLPKIAGSTSSGSNRRPSQTQTPDEGPGSPVISQPLGKRQTFSPGTECAP